MVVPRCSWLAASVTSSGSVNLIGPASKKFIPGDSKSCWFVFDGANTGAYVVETKFDLCADRGTGHSARNQTRTGSASGHRFKTAPAAWNM